MAEEKPRQIPHPDKPDAIGYYDVYLEVRVFLNLRPYGGEVIKTEPPPSLVESIAESFHGHKRAVSSSRHDTGSDAGGE
ncbi:MAG TPA: hypothetical protein VFL98_01365 [Candidatus Paceibacterota bacterium]|nr:hypothetical protein [Candidatus Paceibacterota bacterium]